MRRETPQLNFGMFLDKAFVQLHAIGGEGIGDEGNPATGFSARRRAGRGRIKSLALRARTLRLCRLLQARSLFKTVLLERITAHPVSIDVDSQSLPRMPTPRLFANSKL